MKILTKKIGICMMIVGIVFQFLNIITYGYWGIDIDIIGALIFIIGLIILIISFIKNNKKTSNIKKKKITKSLKA
jgi:hypothetical protein